MLKAATSGYSKENLVGKIGKLEIYMGTLRDGTEVRIEVYREKTSSEEYKKFVEECRVLVQLRHTNLVQILGWCAHRGFRALITEWRGGETIDMWLSSSSPPWKKRLKVLKGVLQGMLNLQEQWPEVGFDVNTNNVLLAEDGEPLITKFRVGEGNSNGTNIYKFGVFLFEMVTSKQTKGFKRGKVGFVEWVRSHYHENIWIVIDDRLKKAGVTYEEAKHGIRLGLMCTDPSTEQHFSLFQMPEMINLVSSSSNKRKLHGERTEHRKTPARS
ncbi:hypothetical protein IFM89_028746 [Coptis chinensis]|uniref:Protein kinase domain-containing protein n=1 Tax=Coptis chinensis TaxID=261450 RepID=A0A835LJP7_9MAGN|nr:hypothetical protein IFM89_028746 [Coptis chinensis]